MKSLKKTSLTLGLALGLLAMTSIAKAANNLPINIRVSVDAGASIAVDNSSFNFGPLAVSTKVVSPAFVVTNDSSGLRETYEIRAANMNKVGGGGTPWNINSAIGNNQFRLDAQFASAPEADDHASWNDDNLGVGAVTADGTTTLTDGSATGYQVLPTGTRNLYFRFSTPSSVSDASEHELNVTLTANAD